MANVGNEEACCDVCAVEPGCVAWTVRDATDPTKGTAYSCSLYNVTDAIAADKDVVASGRMPDARTHYQDPAKGCLPDELNLTVANIVGSWCSAACGPKSSDPCPLDVPTGVAAKPSCAINDPVGTGKHCALVCTADAECGADIAVHCDTTFTPGVCAYRISSGGRSLKALKRRR